MKSGGVYLKSIGIYVKSSGIYVKYALCVSDFNETFAPVHVEVWYECK